jgi:diguanylate cyclase (GGDEF)-like protein/PAS domain S-box-containing protein
MGRPAMPSSPRDLAAAFRPGSADGDPASDEFTTSLTRALVESRQRYKDLSELGGDFAWETDALGKFAFVSPGGALGYSADRLIGQDPRDLAVEGQVSIFTTKYRETDVELSLRRADGAIASVIASAVPILAADGSFGGARGIWRDVTRERARERELAQVRSREQLVMHLLRTVRDEVEPEQALAKTLEATALALAADGGLVLRGDGELAAHAGDNPDATRLDAALARLGAGAALDAGFAERGILGEATRHRSRVNGSVLFWRVGGSPFSDDEQALVADLAGQFGAILAASGNQARVLAMSRTDPLTGLLNRRGFFDALEAAMAGAAGPAALLYADIDNLKLLNDTRGHEVGDEALRALAEMLRENTRKGDLVARLGGDEFALWLDGADAEAAERRIESLLVASLRLAAAFATEDAPIGLSVGFAPFDPAHPRPMEQLITKADRAMYRMKRAHKRADQAMLRTVALP